MPIQPITQYLAYFHGNRDYFFCHDILEEYWKSIQPINQSSYLVGLIQLAVGLYHYRAGNLTGAKKMLKKSNQIQKKNIEELNTLGINGTQLVEVIEQYAKDLAEKMPFQDLQIPIISEKLEADAINYCNQMNMVWKDTSPVSNDIRYKHRLRDRSEVLHLRQQELQLRHSNKKQ